ncbi:MAG: ribosome biogenesis GTPase YlqF [Eubacteriales bacterium]
MNIQWYPGHMAKTKRMIAESLKLCDVVCEVIDSRIPVSSRNPDINALTAGKPRVIILNRCDQADPAENSLWVQKLSKEACCVIETNSKSGQGVKKFATVVRKAAGDKIKRAAENNRSVTVRAMILGVPNVGKSSLINRIIGGNRAKAEDRPGVTRGKQWFTVGRNLELLDTPGILWPKFEDPTTGMMLAFTGAIRDEIIDTEELAANLIKLLADRYPQAVTARYKVEPVGSGYDILTAAAIKRGCIISGGEPDMERISNIVLDEYRSGKLGRFTLERCIDTDDDEQ